jgi:hypothetical protein
MIVVYYGWSVMMKPEDLIYIVTVFYFPYVALTKEIFFNIHHNSKFVNVADYEVSEFQIVCIHLLLHWYS